MKKSAFSVFALCAVGVSFADAQVDVTSAAFDMVNNSSFFDDTDFTREGSDSSFQSFTGSEVNFEHSLDANLSFWTVTLDSVVSQQSQLVGNTLSASSAFGFETTFGSSSAAGGTYAESFATIQIRVDRPTEYSLLTNGYRNGSYFGLRGNLDSGGEVTVYEHFFAGEVLDEGVLMPGDYSIMTSWQFYGSTFIEDWVNSGQSGLPTIEPAPVWGFELTLIPSPSVLAGMPLVCCLALKRRRS